jgi:hypothetical protein
MFGHLGSKHDMICGVGMTAAHLVAILRAEERARWDE